MEPIADAEFAALIRTIAARGDRSAFARLFAHFAPRVKAYLQRGKGARQVRALVRELRAGRPGGAR